MEDTPKKFGIILIIIAIFLIVGGGAYFMLKGKTKFVSPVPAEPSFKVIYFTPTPGPVTPSSTPSATPKVNKSPTSKPTASEVSPTAKPAITLTPNP